MEEMGRARTSYTDMLKVVSILNIKGTVSVISSDPPCRKGMLDLVVKALSNNQV